MSYTSASNSQSILIPIACTALTLSFLESATHRPTTVEVVVREDLRSRAPLPPLIAEAEQLYALELELARWLHLSEFGCAFLPKELIRVIFHYAAPPPLAPLPPAPSGSALASAPATVQPSYRYPYHAVSLNGARTCVAATIVLNADPAIDQPIPSAAAGAQPVRTRTAPCAIAFDDTAGSVLARALAGVNETRTFLGADFLKSDDLVLCAGGGTDACYLVDRRLWEYDSVRHAIRYERPITLLVRTLNSLKLEFASERIPELAVVDGSGRGGAAITSPNIPSGSVSAPLRTALQSFEFIRPPPLPASIRAAREIADYRHIRIETFLGFGVTLVTGSVQHFRCGADGKSAADARVTVAPVTRSVCGCAHATEPVSVPIPICTLPPSTKLLIAVYDTSQRRAAPPVLSPPMPMSAATKTAPIRVLVPAAASDMSAQPPPSAAHVSPPAAGDSKPPPASIASTCAAPLPSPGAATLLHDGVATYCTACAIGNVPGNDQLIGYASVPLFQPVGCGESLQYQLVGGARRIRLWPPPDPPLERTGVRRACNQQRFAPPLFRQIDASETSVDPASEEDGGDGKTPEDAQRAAAAKLAAAIDSNPFWSYATTDVNDDSTAPAVIMRFDAGDTNQSIVYAAVTPSTPPPPPPATFAAGILKAESKDLMSIVDAPLLSQLKFASRTLRAADTQTEDARRQALLWHWRRALKASAILPLTTFLMFIDWTKPAQFPELYELIRDWPAVPATAPATSLQSGSERRRFLVRNAVALLDARYHDPNVRAQAVEWLSAHSRSDEDRALLHAFWPQILECVKCEVCDRTSLEPCAHPRLSLVLLRLQMHDNSPLARFVVDSAVSAPLRLLQPFVWFCHTEIARAAAYRVRYSKLLALALSRVDPRWRARFDAQIAFVRVLGGCISKYLNRRGHKPPREPKPAEVEPRTDSKRELHGTTNQIEHPAIAPIPVPVRVPVLPAAPVSGGVPLSLTPTPDAKHDAVPTEVDTPWTLWKQRGQRIGLEVATDCLSELRAVFDAAGGVIRSPVDPCVQLTGVYDIKLNDEFQDRIDTDIDLRVRCTIRHTTLWSHAFRFVCRDVRSDMAYSQIVAAVDSIMLAGGMDLCFAPPVRAVAVGGVPHRQLKSSPLPASKDSGLPTAVRPSKFELFRRKWFGAPDGIAFGAGLGGDTSSGMLPCGIIEMNAADRVTPLSTIIREEGGTFGALRVDSVNSFLTKCWPKPPPPPPSATPAKSVATATASAASSSAASTSVSASSAIASTSGAAAAPCVAVPTEWDLMLARYIRSVAAAQLCACVLQGELSNDEIAIDNRGRVSVFGDLPEVFGHLEPAVKPFSTHGRVRMTGTVVSFDILYVMGGKKYTSSALFKSFLQISETAHQFFAYHALFDVQTLVAPYRFTGADRSFRYFDVALASVDRHCGRATGFGDPPEIAVPRRLPPALPAGVPLSTVTAASLPTPTVVAPAATASIVFSGASSSQPSAKKLAKYYDRFIYDVVDRFYRRLDNFRPMG